MNAQPNNVLPMPNAKGGATSAPPLVVSAQEETERLNHLKELIRDCMEEGKDWGRIPGINAPILFKEGAEKLLSWHGLGVLVEVVNRIEKLDKPFFAYEVKVSIQNKRTKVIEAESIGACNTEERGKKKGFDGHNNALKIAKKRALVDATLLATRTSSMFKNEDFDESEETPLVAQRQQTPPQRSNQQSQPTSQQRPPQQSQQQRPAPAEKELVSKELLANYNRIRCWAIEAGYRTAKGNKPVPVADGAPRAEVEQKLIRLRDWLKTNAPDKLKDEKDIAKYPVPRGAEFRPCRSCGLPITLAPTKNGGQMPIDADGVVHFAICTNPGAHRKPAQPKPASSGTTPPKRELPPHVKRLWMVANEYQLPTGNEHRDERIYNSGQILLDHRFDLVESWNALNEEQARCLIAAIEAGLLTWGQPVEATATSEVPA